MVIVSDNAHDFSTCNNNAANKFWEIQEYDDDLTAIGKTFK